MSASSLGRKRERDVDDSSTEHGSPTAGRGGLLDDAAGGSSSTTNFRNVSACNRCRNRKNRCDQKLPRCSGCEKANVKCVGFDPVSKRAIPRSYVYYLETRVRSLEGILEASGIQIPPPQEDFAINDDIKPGVNVPFPVLEEDPGLGGNDGSALQPARSRTLDPALRSHDDGDRLDKLVNDVGMVSVRGHPPSKKVEPASGVSFARVVLAAVKSAVPHTPSERSGTKASKLATGDIAGGGGTSMRDSFFGLYSRPAVKAAPFPDEATGRSLMELYFEHANPQIPILHRVEFEALFDQVYATDPKKRTSREYYFLNMVFAIGSGIIMDSSSYDQSAEMDTEPPTRKRQRKIQKHQPEDYHSSAVVHLETFLSASPVAQSSSAGLEELQAVLLLASLALLRPVSPGLWYIIGVAVRLAVDLGLHSEEVEPELETHQMYPPDDPAVGRKQWVRDLRRRLWWCVYAFDKLVSTCVGRPVGISDQVITTEFPSLLDDRDITPAGFLRPPDTVAYPTAKLVGHHYTRLRLLQSEILQVLQHRSAEQMRAFSANGGNPYLYKDLPSPFLAKFPSFREWRWNVDQRLKDWKDSIPEPSQIGVSFTPLFFELNYFQAIILLYRSSLAVPEALAEINPSSGSDVQSPGSMTSELKEDEEFIFMKVAQAGQCVLKIYRQLHRLKLVNYTFLASHHIFMSGISFLYAIWHSSIVRSQLTLDDVDFTILIATSVLTDLSERCPPAEACREALVRMSKATISMVERSTGFGSASILSSRLLQSPVEYFGTSVGSDGVYLQTPTGETSRPNKKSAKRRLTMPKFDMNLKELFSDEEIANRPLPHQHLRALDHNSDADDLNLNSSRATRMQYMNPTTAAAAASSPSHQQPFSALSPHHPQAQAQAQQPDLSLPLSNQQPYAPFASTIAQAQPDFSFDDMSFLDTFPVADPSGNGWGSWNDLSFVGTGGSGYDDATAAAGGWNGGAQVDLFGGLFFGGETGGGDF